MKIVTFVMFVAVFLLRGNMGLGFLELLISLFIVIVLFGLGQFGKILGALDLGLHSLNENLNGETGEPDTLEIPKNNDYNLS
jgi:Sec-independent protein translocase protein TatA